MRLSSIVLGFALAASPAWQLAAQSDRLAPNAPADQPVNGVMTCQWEATLKAMSPYSARARATYPAARARFFDRSKPSRPMFVTALLADSLRRHEQVFIAVDSIVGTRIIGKIASQIEVVAGYRYGQRYAIDERDLVDWMFANPDGSEEGNVVGKFLDTYAPPKSCGAT